MKFGILNDHRGIGKMNPTNRSCSKFEFALLLVEKGDSLQVKMEFRLHHNYRITKDFAMKLAIMIIHC